MKIQITQTVEASPNGIAKFLYREGEEYAVPSSKMPDDLAKVFIKEKWAKEVKEQKDQGGAKGTKDAGGAPENKQSGGQKKKGFFGKGK